MGTERKGKREERVKKVEIWAGGHETWVLVSALVKSFYLTLDESSPVSQLVR